MDRRGQSRAERLNIDAPPRLNPDALTIGFARRFATYKRADLLFGDIDRLAYLLNQAPGPVQFLFAGKRTLLTCRAKGFTASLRGESGSPSARPGHPP